MHNPIMRSSENSRLKVLRAATEQRNFHKAAGRPFLTHPAVTLQFKALKATWARGYSIARAKKFPLTRQGSVLLTYANEVAAMVSEASTLYHRGGEMQ